MNMKTLVLFLTLFSSFFFSASTLAEVSVLKIYKNNVFAVKKNGLKKGGNLYIYTPDGKKILALAKVGKCKGTACLARPVKARKGFRMSSRFLVSSKPLNKKASKGKAASTSKAEAGNMSVFAGAGGPLTYGLRGKLRYSFSDRFSAGATLGYTDFELTEINISGFTAGAELLYELYEAGGFKILALGEGGYLVTSLDYADDGESTGPQVEASVPYFMGGAEARYSFTQSLGAAVSLAYVRNFFDDYYENEAGDAFSMPLSEGIVTLDFGLTYKF